MNSLWWDALWAGVRDGGRPPSILTLMWFVGCVWLGSVLKLKRKNILIAVLVSLVVTVGVRLLMHLGLWGEWYMDRVVLRRLQMLEAGLLGLVLAGLAAVILCFRRQGFDETIKNTAISFWPHEAASVSPLDRTWVRMALLFGMGVGGAFVSSWIVFMGGFDPVLLRVYKVLASSTGFVRYEGVMVYLLASLWPCWMLVLWLMYTPPIQFREVWARRSIVFSCVIALALILSCILLRVAGDRWRPPEQSCCTAQETDL